MVCPNRKSFTKLNFTIILLIASIDFASQTLISGEKGAYIREFNHKLTIYQQTSDIWNLTVYNAEYEENDAGEAWFFFRFYIDENLWLDEYNSTEYKVWLCQKGTAISRIYKVKGWGVLEPQNLRIKIELYRFYDGKFYLEDTICSNVTIVMILPIKHIYVFSYFAAYLVACFLLLAIYYISGLTPE